MSPEILEKEHPDLGCDQVIPSPNPASAEAFSEIAEHNARLEQRLEHIQNILEPALNAKHALDWELFKRNEEYGAAKPRLPSYLDYPPEPTADDPRYQPQFAPGELPGTPAAERKKRDAFEQFVAAYTAWAEAVKRIEALNQKRYEQAAAAIEEWNRASHNHHEAQTSYNAAIDQRRSHYEACQPDAVEDYCRQVLNASPLPEPFRRQFDLQYHADTRTLIVEHSLPMPDALPRLKGLKYVKKHGRWLEAPLPVSARNRIYSSVLHQICLRTLHELYDADVAGAVHTVVFNGWVPANTSAQPNTRTWLMSVRATREVVKVLNLWDADARACFKALKGQAKSKLHTFSPVVPILNITRFETPEPAAAKPASTWTETELPAAATSA